MADDEKKGIYLPGWVWNAVQAGLTAAVIGGYGMFYSMHSDIAGLKLKVESLEKRNAKLEADQAEHDANEGQIREDVASIKAELPYIKGGVDEIKTLLRSR